MKNPNFFTSYLKMEGGVSGCELPHDIFLSGTKPTDMPSKACCITSYYNQALIMKS